MLAESLFGNAVSGRPFQNERALFTNEVSHSMPDTDFNFSGLKVLDRFPARGAEAFGRVGGSCGDVREERLARVVERDAERRLKRDPPRRARARRDARTAQTRERVRNADGAVVREARAEKLDP